MSQFDKKTATRMVDNATYPNLTVVHVVEARRTFQRGNVWHFIHDIYFVADDNTKYVGENVLTSDRQYDYEIGEVYTVKCILSKIGDEIEFVSKGRRVTSGSGPVASTPKPQALPTAKNESAIQVESPVPFYVTALEVAARIMCVEAAATGEQILNSSLFERANELEQYLIDKRNQYAF